MFKIIYVVIILMSCEGTNVMWTDGTFDTAFITLVG